MAVPTRTAPSRLSRLAAVAALALAPALSALMPAAPAAAGAGSQPVQAGDPAGGGEALSEEERRQVESAFEDFRVRFDLMNRRIGEAMGEPPFAALEHEGGYTIRLTSNEWWKENRGQHQRNALVLYSMWAEVNGRRPVKLLIADKNGENYIIVEGTPRGMKYLERK